MERAIVVENPGRPEVQAVFIRSHLRMLAMGMKGRLTLREVLKKASAITGQEYRHSRKSLERAVLDLTSIIEATKRG